MKVTVVVPVFNAPVSVYRCLSALSRAVKRGSGIDRVIVVDDASSTPTAVIIDTLVRDFGFDLVRSETNQGFTFSANVALAMESRNHVLLLNSDAFIGTDTVDRLLKVAHDLPNFASLTPLTNNGTIASFPDSIHGLQLPSFGADKIDEACRQLDAPPVEAPTGVGSCMLLSRKGLDAVGTLNYEWFPRGYGEENEWCQRARKCGLTNYIVPSCFVEHTGTQSFTEDEKAVLAHDGLLKVLEAAPSYTLQVASFLRTQPLARTFADVAIALIAEGGKTSAPVEGTLHVTHNLGGGTEIAVAALIRNGPQNSIVARPRDGHNFALEFEHPHAIVPCSLQWGSIWIAQALKTLRITKVILHNLVGWDESARRVLVQAAKSARADVEVVLHDYQWLCPQIHLIDATNSYCGLPSLSDCEKCCEGGNTLGVHRAVQWRAESVELSKVVSRFVAPSRDVLERHRLLLSDAEIVEESHANFDVFRSETTNAEVVLRQSSEMTATELRILVIGSIGIHKGAGVLKRLVDSVAYVESGFNLIILGGTAFPLGRGVTDLGYYDDRNLLSSIEAVDPDVIFLPFVWPETYSFVTSAAICSGRPMVTFDIGAPAERLRRDAGRRSLLLPLELQDHPDKLLNLMGKFVASLSKMSN